MPKSKHSIADFTQLKQQFLADVVTTVEMEEIPAELILNWDQTGVKIVPPSTWTMDAKGSKRVEMAGVNDNRPITAALCGSLTGDFLPVGPGHLSRENQLLSSPLSVNSSLGYYPFTKELVQ